MEAQNRSPLCRQYQIEDVFDSYDEYQQYFVKALGRLKEQVKRRNPSLQKFVPERLEIIFVKKLKAPRYYIPRFEGTIVLEVPDKAFSPKKKAAIRQLRLDAHIGVIKINEMQCADQMAMRMKIMFEAQCGGRQTSKK